MVDLIDREWSLKFKNPIKNTLRTMDFSLTWMDFPR